MANNEKNLQTDPIGTAENDALGNAAAKSVEKPAANAADSAENTAAGGRGVSADASAEAGGEGVEPRANESRGDKAETRAEPSDEGADGVKQHSAFHAFGRRTLNTVKEYYEIVRDWLTGKRGSRADRWAFALCLLLAVSVWLYVMSTEKTGYEQRVSGVNVGIEGTSSLSSSNMSVIDGYDSKVTITLSGKRGDIGSLTADDVRVYVDVSQITETGRYNLPVQVELPKNSSLVSIEPSQISVNVDVNTSRTVDVKVKLDYVLNAAYTLEEPEADHKTVVISGPASVLDTVSYAAVSFNAGVIDRSLNLVGSVALYDEYGMVISNPYVKCNVTEIKVYVNVTTTKNVPLKIRFTNGVSSNYNVTMHPSEVTIVGDPQLVSGINELYVYTVNDGDIQVGNPLILHISEFQLPEGVSVVDSERGVSIDIERIY